jgi:catechol 2,3-dioxygenase-like lactoylglutathione lyase family enzyme
LLELVQSDSPTEVTKPQSPEEWNAFMFGQVGAIHLGFRVDDMEEAIRKLTDSGGELVVPPVEYTPEITFVDDVKDEKLVRASRPRKKPSWRIAMFCDPDGVMLEILER